jgi:hypothetical protein
MNLDTVLKQLRLSALGQSLPVRLQEAAANRLSHAEFLELILHDEINVREQRKISRRTQAAEFTALKSLEDFEWRFNTTISRKDIYELAACHFVRKATFQIQTATRCAESGVAGPPDLSGAKLSVQETSGISTAVDARVCGETTIRDEKPIVAINPALPLC